MHGRAVRARARADSDYEPYSGIVRCGEAPLPGDALAATDPLIVVEVLSPTTARYDRAIKLTESLLAICAALSDRVAR